MITMVQPVKILLVGIGGYGSLYVDALLHQAPAESATIVGAVDPYPESCPYLQELQERSVPLYSSLEAFYADQTADLAVISTPIHRHPAQVMLALAHGSHVLCEKPLCATIQEAQQMLQAQRTADKTVAVGYQWSFSNAILTLKRDIQQGLFGRPIRLKTLILWPRDARYYGRSWAGRQRDGEGAWVLDSVANNATAHYLHNMFFVLGQETAQSAKPAFVSAELYRANAIENFDTAAIQCTTTDGVGLWFYASHATQELLDPVFQYEFENATVHYGGRSGPESEEIIAEFQDGRRQVYGNPNDHNLQKLWTTITAVHQGKTVPCGIETSMSQTLCINGAQESMREIETFPAEIRCYDPQTQVTWVEGLGETLKECYHNWTTPSQLGVTWAKTGRRVELGNYYNYPGGA